MVAACANRQPPLILLVQTPHTTQATRVKRPDFSERRLQLCHKPIKVADGCIAEVASAAKTAFIIYGACSCHRRRPDEHSGKVPRYKSPSPSCWRTKRKVAGFSPPATGLSRRDHGRVLHCRSQSCDRTPETGTDTPAYAVDRRRGCGHAE